MNQKKGFTLIELLVVISIIALLLAILMPALGKAKDLAAGVVCMSNEKQLTLAWILYAEENNGKICDAFPYQNATGKSGGDWSFVAAPITTSGGKPSPYTMEDRIRGFEKGALWEYLKSYEVFHCPADTRWKKNSSNGAYRSYSIGGVLSPSTGGNWGGQDKYAITKIGNFTSPSEKFIFLEETEKEQPYNEGAWDIFLNKPAWIDPFAILHNNASTFGYADGHSGRNKWTQERTRWMAEGGHKWQDVIDGKHPNSTTEDYDWFVRHYAPRPAR